MKVDYNNHNVVRTAWKTVNKKRRRKKDQKQMIKLIN